MRRVTVPDRAKRSIVASVALQSAIAEVLDLVLLDVAVVLVERGREGVRAVVLADEVQIRDVRRGAAASSDARPGDAIGPGGRPA